MNCPHCGYENVPQGARHCPNCGQALPRTPQPATQIEVRQEVGEVEGGQVTGVDIRQVIGNVFVGTDQGTLARQRRNLRVLLDKVKGFWVAGVLERSVQGAALIELDKRSLPQAVHRPLEAIAPPPALAEGESPFATELQAGTTLPAGIELPAGTEVLDVFDEMDHALLILDGAGGGKTTSLLELARDIAARADQDPLQPIPVVLHLSSWAGPRQSIAEWAVDELSAKYQIPRQVGRRWLEEADLALLLDGLDEVDEGRRTACIEALNQFRQDHGLVQVGVCCRTEAYESAGGLLQLQGAISLQPLTREQIERYLDAAGPSMEALHQVLREDEALRELARSPLMLNIMRLAYQDTPPEALRDEGLDMPEERRAHLLHAYVERAFRQVTRPGIERTSRQQATHWLARIAEGMSREGQALFLIEQLQPSWLPDRAWRWLYALLSRLVLGVLIGVVSSAWGFTLHDVDAVAQSYLVLGPVGGLLFGLVDGVRFELESRRREERLSVGLGGRRRAGRRSQARRRGQPDRSGQVWEIVATVLSVLLMWGLTYSVRMVLDWVVGLREGIFFGLMFGLILGFKNRGRGWREDIQTVEALAWFRIGSIRGAIVGLLTALVGSILFGLVAASWIEPRYGLPAAKQWAVTFAPTLTLIGLLLGGLHGRIVETKTHLNQGIRLSIRNATFVGLVVGVLGALGEGLTAIVIRRPSSGPGAWPAALPVSGLFWGVIVALWYGGLDLIKHTILRALLALSGCLPWRLAPFLDDAAGRALMQRVGGGCMFVNRLLQTYFADARDRA